MNDAWLRAFPQEEATRSVQFLRDSWNELVNRSLPKFSLSQSEPKLTESLASYLIDNSITIARLSGQWSYEAQGGKFNYKTGGIDNRHRKDITYFSNKSEIVLNIVFEFKKLKHSSTSYKHYFDENGMERFVTGYYSSNEPLAIMVAILLDPKVTCVTELKRKLLESKVVSALKMVRYANGGYINDPTSVFPGITDFDTTHENISDNTYSTSQKVITHLFLEFP